MNGSGDAYHSLSDTIAVMNEQGSLFHAVLWQRRMDPQVLRFAESIGGEVVTASGGNNDYVATTQGCIDTYTEECWSIVLNHLITTVVLALIVVVHAHQMISSLHTMSLRKKERHYIGAGYATPEKIIRLVQRFQLFTDPETGDNQSS